MTKSIEQMRRDFEILQRAKQYQTTGDDGTIYTPVHALPAMQAFVDAQTGRNMNKNYRSKK